MARPKKLRAAVVGCGSIAQHCHLPGYAKDKSCDIVAVVDPSPARLREVKKDFEIGKAYRDWERMFDREEFDVVSICTPNALHASQAIAALKKGAHVLCEKPLCLSMAEARRIQKAHAKSGTVFMTGFTHRFMTGNQKAKTILQKGEIGKPFMIRSRFAHSGPIPDWAKSDWFHFKKPAGGGALLDMGIHSIDIVQYLLGPITAVSAQIGNLVKDIEVDDNALMLLEFDGTMMGYIEVGWTSKPGFAGTEVYGSDGTMFIDYLQGLKVLKGRTTPDGKTKLAWRTADKNPTKGGWDVEVGEFLKSVRKGVQPAESLEAGISALAVALAAYRSAKEGRRVTIKEVTG